MSDTLAPDAHMRPLSVQITAKEALSLALLNMDDAWQCIQHGECETHDYLEARAAYLFREVQKVSPELAKGEKYRALQQLP